MWSRFKAVACADLVRGSTFLTPGLFLGFGMAGGVALFAAGYKLVACAIDVIGGAL
ncbi:MAG: hypothetical protein VB101_07185 [Rhodospirillaceae bacterium]|nr:hypothetical protein [Rhodospirillaceae bacterium]